MSGTGHEPRGRFRGRGTDSRSGQACKHGRRAPQSRGRRAPGPMQMRRWITSIALAATEHSTASLSPTAWRWTAASRLPRMTVAYRTYGTLNAGTLQRRAGLPCADRRSVCRRAAPVTGKEGWWEMVVGPGRPMDTDRFFVICANVLGGCMGSTGPRSMRDGDGDAVGAPTSRRSPSATWSARRSG